MAFAGANWKPLLQLRDAWATEASIWLNQRGQLKRAFEREQEAVRAAEARAAVLKRRGVGDGNDQPAKRLRVRSAQVAKAKYPGSLTVTPGETCIFVEVCNNPMWSRVKMDDDGRMGLVSASRLEELPEEAPLPDPSDDEQMPDPSDDDTDAHEEARITTADDAQAEAKLLRRKLLWSVGVLLRLPGQRPRPLSRPLLPKNAATVVTERVACAE